MPPVVLKLLAGQGTGQTDGRTDRLYASPFWEHNKASLSQFHLKQKMNQK